MGELTTLLSLVKGQATEVTMFLTALFVAVTLYLNNRKVNAEVLTTMSKAQAESMQSLIDQNKALATDLHDLRTHQKELHADLDKLRHQNARMYQHILALEQAVAHYARRCDDCPAGPGPVPTVPSIPFDMEAP